MVIEMIVKLAVKVIHGHAYWERIYKNQIILFQMNNWYN